MEINDLKRHEQSIVAARDYAEAILRIAPEPLAILNADLRIHMANQAFYCNADHRRLHQTTD